MNNILKNILFFICLLSLIGAAVYRLSSLNNISVIISLICAIIAYFIILQFRPLRNEKHKTNNKYNKPKITCFILYALYFILLSYCFYILLTHQTTQAIISPWEVMPAYFFAIYGLSTAVLIMLILQNKKSALLLIIPYYFLSFSIAVIIYKLGYGFDFFIHGATMDLIDKTGAVEPKPFYYLGQYALIIIIHKITFIPIIWLNKFLVPLLASVFLPLSLFSALKKLFNDKKKINLTIIALLIIPFSIFIVTIPQNLAYLFLLILILFGLTCSSVFDLIIIYLLALTALVIQPIAGIPALLFAFLLTIYHSRHKMKKYFYGLIFILNIIILPLAFYFVEKNNRGMANPADIRNQAGDQISFLEHLKIIIPGQENFILNFIYLYAFNIKTIIAFLAIAGIIITLKHKKECRIFSIYFSTALALFLSYFLTKNLSFNFLISYERSNYANRLLTIACLFLTPFILTAIYGFFNKLFKQNKIIKYAFLIFIIILISASLYISYPRFDHYHNSHGYAVSQTDIDAARWIEKNKEQDYIVLANQQVSAAAIREFGFKKYYQIKSLEIRNYNLDIFYYPIPTGDPLYQYYLAMVYKKPDRATILKAMNLVGVKEGYFVLNKYWWAFPKISEEAKLEANSWQEINNGEIYIFKYKM